jgi:hypothetical protein
MKLKILLFSFLAVFLLAGSATATTILDSSGETYLYQIWGSLFSDSSFSSSQDLWNAYGVKGDDSTWYETDSGAVYIEIRYAGYNQAFGYSEDGGATRVELFGFGDINWGNNYLYATLNTGSFIWYEQYDDYDSDQSADGTWYSLDTLNIDGQNDHFVAFSVPSDLVNYYNLNNGNNPDLSDNVYLLAFEDLNLGDKDYNDLVVLVDEVAPISEPATMLLFGSGLIGLAALGRKKIFK